MMSVKRIQHEKLLQQNEVLPWLSLALPKGSKVWEFAKPGGRPTCPRCNVVVGRLAGGTPPGWPDLLIMAPGCRDIYIELKWGTNKPDSDQLRVHAELAGMDKGVYTCWSLDDVRGALWAEEIPLRGE